MPPEKNLKKPCPCPKCKGALMSKKQSRGIESAASYGFLPSVNIMTYKDWTKLEAGENAGGTNEMSSSGDEEIFGKPSKRCRTGREIQPELVCHRMCFIIDCDSFFLNIHHFLSFLPLFSPSLPPSLVVLPTSPCTIGSTEPRHSHHSRFSDIAHLARHVAS